MIAATLGFLLDFNKSTELDDKSSEPDDKGNCDSDNLLKLSQNFIFLQSSPGSTESNKSRTDLWSKPEAF